MGFQIEFLALSCPHGYIPQKAVKMLGNLTDCKASGLVKTACYPPQEKETWGKIKPLRATMTSSDFSSFALERAM